jgi:hypothetical protein
VTVAGALDAGDEGVERPGSHALRALGVLHILSAAATVPALLGSDLTPAWR